MTIGLSAHASSKFLTLTLIYDPNPNPIPCEILDVEILDACADSPIVINFASGEFRATPDAAEGLANQRPSLARVSVHALRTQTITRAVFVMAMSYAHLGKFG